MSRVGLVFGGRSVEHRVSLVSARAVAGALREAGHEVVGLGIAQDGCWVDPNASQVVLDGSVEVLPPVGAPVRPTLRHLLGAPVDVFFPVVHGTWGEDGTLQGLFEMLAVPYVGAGVTPSALGMDKRLFKAQLRAAGLPMVESEAVSLEAFRGSADGALTAARELPFPVFVKPSAGGSSVGVRRVEEPAGLEEAVRFAFGFDDWVLIERAARGRELECAVLGYRDLEASAVGEIVPGRAFYDYADKYLEEGATLAAPADLPEAVAGRVREVAVAAFAALGGWGMARVDFFLEGEDGLLVNELNTIPGFTPISMYPRLWDLAGVPMPELVDRLIDIAIARHDDRGRLDAGIKDWIERLGG